MQIGSDTRRQEEAAGPGGEPGLGFWPATALVVGHTIGVGIFLTPAELVGALASPALTLGLWLVCGLLVFAGALTFGEMAARHPAAGGVYVYLREAWGGRVAFLFGWQALLVMDPGITAALASGFAEYFVVLWPSAAGFERWTAVISIWAAAGCAMAGLGLGARVLTAFTVLKVAALAGIAIAAFAVGAGRWEHFSPFFGRAPGAPVPVVEAVAIGIISVFFSFGGFWEAGRVASEVRDAPRTLPRALAAGIACVTAIYVTTTAAFLYLVPARSAVTAPELARAAGEAVLGPIGPSVLAAIVLLSIVSSALALFIMAPRLYVAMSADRLFPRFLAARDGRTGVPVRATTLLAALASLYAAVASFQQILAFFMCTTLTFVALAAGAIFVERRRSAPARFAAPGYPVTPILFVLLVAAIVLMIAINRPVQAAAGLVVLLFGLVAHQAMTSVPKPK